MFSSYLYLLPGQDWASHPTHTKSVAPMAKFSSLSANGGKFTCWEKHLSRNRLETSSTLKQVHWVGVEGQVLHTSSLPSLQDSTNALACLSHSQISDIAHTFWRGSSMHIWNMMGDFSVLWPHFRLQVQTRSHLSFLKTPMASLILENETQTHYLDLQVRWPVILTLLLVAPLSVSDVS